MAEKYKSWSPYNYTMNNPLNLIDPDGKAPDWIFDQQKDGSYKRREGVANDGGATNHTYNNSNGTTSYYNQKENTFVTVNPSNSKEKIAKYEKMINERNAVVKDVGKVVNNTGDAIAAAGYIGAPVTEGASLTLSAAGEGISLVGKLIENAANFNESGFTKENVVNASIDIAAELAPLPVESTIKQLPVANVTK